ncbi:MAG: hypothetical protein E7146_02825 [Rikenellaceae bacterium]|nr:hypothetical protein [Rikenellaceae bacterium]
MRFKAPLSRFSRVVHFHSSTTKKLSPQNDTFLGSNYLLLMPYARIRPPLPLYPRRVKRHTTLPSYRHSCKMLLKHAAPMY